ncbi:MAG: aminotransferase class I/II-fold pyridoxal phosphate-dependent enzyme [Spirochaetes bacterium]|nr:aminotransferase class I/II-fold pyridoxal phosphate-dependent enzyme [Spirochaetota bacterium]
MESLISNAGKSIPPSGIREFFDIVYSTPDCITLGVGEPDFVTPWRISDTGAFAIREGYTHYTPNRGIPELLNLISSMLYEKNGVEYDSEDELLVTMGVSQGLDIALRSIINPGDEVIIIEPCYVSYAATIELALGKPVAVQTTSNNDFKIDVSRLREAITPKTKAVLLNYPGNPTGQTIDRESLEIIAKIATEKNIIVLSDEIYCSIIYDKEHFSITSVPGMKERTIYLNGFSKAYAMTGWRLGYIAGPSVLISTMLKIHQYTALCAPSMSQYAAVEAIEKADKDVEKMRQEYLKRRNFIVNEFNDMGLNCIMPAGAFYAFPDIKSTGLSSRDFALGLLKAEKVAVVPGEVFGECGQGHIRCSYATAMDDLKEALKRIRRYVNTL